MKYITLVVFIFLGYLVGYNSGYNNGYDRGYLLRGQEKASCVVTTDTVD